METETSAPAHCMRAGDESCDICNLFKFRRQLLHKCLAFWVLAPRECNWENLSVATSHSHRSRNVSQSYRVMSQQSLLREYTLLLGKQSLPVLKCLLSPSLHNFKLLGAETGRGRQKFLSPYFSMRSTHNVTFWGEFYKISDSSVTSCTSTNGGQN